MEFPVIYEDTDIVAIAKPAGVMTHPDGRTTEETVSDWFLQHYPASSEVGETQTLQDGTELHRPGIVHRLDRDTSGLLVLAKTPASYERLKHAFQHREIEKTYLAIVAGVPKEVKGTIDFSIGRSRKDFRLRSAQPKAKGTLREACTHYKVIGNNGTHAVLKVEPQTGRTHQIRVHLKAIHHPIIGDELYAPHHVHDLGSTRLALHAYRLVVPKESGEKIELIAPLPPDFEATLSRIGEPNRIIASV